MRPSLSAWIVLSLGVVAACPVGGASAAPNPYTAAAKVDELLVKEIPPTADDGDKKADDAAWAPSDDETYLRRVALDITGRSPTPEEITAFVLDPSPAKRHRIIDKLLERTSYGENWARYWRDVILSRRSDERSLFVAPALVSYLTEQFNRDTSWDTIARAFITATGDISSNGATAIFMAQLADPANVTAEMSRIFLGVQIQCAQCHDHRTDRWKREQFHELAAFFPRVAIRRDGAGGGPPSFRVVSLDRGGGPRAPGVQEKVTPEHYMPDLEDPTAQGKLMQPVFFATGQKLPRGKSDKERRGTLADWMTNAGGQRWFAKALVNRLWGELVGRGFFDPIDDLGPDRQPTAPQTLEYLADQFVASGYDVKWLFRAIVSTEAYGRAGRSRHDADASPVACSCPQRLRADQLYDALASTLGLPEDNRPPRDGRPRRYLDGPRGSVLRTFGFDPSAPRDELGGSIPQALMLMNSPEVNRSINGRRGDTMLGKLLAETKDDEAVVTELYLRSLAREPSPAELQTCLDHVRTVGNRSAAHEDILWSLVNSTEFLHRK